MRHQEIAERLDELAGRLQTLAPSHADPEAFHLEKDAVRRELLHLAADVRDSGSSDSSLPPDRPRRRGRGAEFR